MTVDPYRDPEIDSEILLVTPDPEPSATIGNPKGIDMSETIKELDRLVATLPPGRILSPQNGEIIQINEIPEQTEKRRNPEIPVFADPTVLEPGKRQKEVARFANLEKFNAGNKRIARQLNIKPATFILDGSRSIYLNGQFWSSDDSSTDFLNTVFERCWQPPFDAREAREKYNFGRTDTNKPLSPTEAHVADINFYLRAWELYYAGAILINAPRSPHAYPSITVKPFLIYYKV